MNGNTRRTSLLAALAVAALGTFGTAEAVAQENGGDAPAERMEMRGKRGGPGMRAFGLDRAIGRLMDRQHELEINDDQMRQLETLRDEARTRLAPMREVMEATRAGMRDGTLTREEARTRMQSIHQGLDEAGRELHGRLEEILEPEQRAALRRSEMGSGMRRAPARGERPESRRRR